ncbi:unnamed protein product, partial [Cochlearia groenlandica]
LRTFKGGLQSNQKETRFDQNCFGNMTNNSFSENWNQTKNYFGLEVIQLPNRLILSLPYWEAHGFTHFKRRLWRPGDTLNQQESSIDVLQCSNMQTIKQILSYLLLHQDLPYLDPEDNQLQQLLSFRIGCDIKTPQGIKRLQNHGYIKRISKYKKD